MIMYAYLLYITHCALYGSCWMYFIDDIICQIIKYTQPVTTKAAT